MGEKNFYQTGNAYLQYEKTVGKNSAEAGDRILIKSDTFRLVNNALAYYLHEDRLATTGGHDIQYKNYVGQIPTIIRVLTSKDGDF